MGRPGEQGGRPLTAVAGQRRPALPALTGLRVLAAAWVVLFHYRDDVEALLPWLDWAYAQTEAAFAAKAAE